MDSGAIPHSLTLYLTARVMCDLAFFKEILIEKKLSINLRILIIVKAFLLLLEAKLPQDITYIDLYLMRQNKQGRSQLVSMLLALARWT